MKPDRRFTSLNLEFWAGVRLISQEVGYTDRKSARVKSPDLGEVKRSLRSLGLDSDHVVDRAGSPTAAGNHLLQYFQHRAKVLNDYVEPRLMDVDRSSRLFHRLHKGLKPTCPIPMNKQRGAKKTPAYFTGIINMLVEANAGGLPCDFDPQRLATFTASGVPLRTLACRHDGAFPSFMNPVAVWETKEYYYTTTFGSRVADGIYETQLDGMELADLRNNSTVAVRHYLFIDGYATWWGLGRSYLCRVVDLMHMGYVDEVLFGHEVAEALPQIVKGWWRVAGHLVQNRQADSARHPSP